MSTPHKCPICNGLGKIYTQPYAIGTASELPSVPCRSCMGTGIVWEPAPMIPTQPWPNPMLPLYTEPVIPLTWPSDFKFPEEVIEYSKAKLISILEDWIKKLKDEDPEENISQEMEEVEGDF